MVYCIKDKSQIRRFLQDGILLIVPRAIYIKYIAYEVDVPTSLSGQNMIPLRNTEFTPDVQHLNFLIFHSIFLTATNILDFGTGRQNLF